MEYMHIKKDAYKLTTYCESRDLESLAYRSKCKEIRWDFFQNQAVDPVSYTP